MLSAVVAGVLLGVVSIATYELSVLRPWTQKFLWVTCKHKWWVLQAGLKTGAPLWRLIVHDLSKFLPSEAQHYGRQYYGDKGDRAGYDRAWHLHQRRNAHHWEYWTWQHYSIVNDTFEIHTFEMPEGIAREMVADWMAASKAYSGHWPTRDRWPWWDANELRIALHPRTRALVNRIIEEQL